MLSGLVSRSDSPREISNAARINISNCSTSVRILENFHAHIHRYHRSAILPYHTLIKMHYLTIVTTALAAATSVMASPLPPKAGEMADSNVLEDRVRNIAKVYRLCNWDLSALYLQLQHRYLARRTCRGKLQEKSMPTCTTR